MERVARLGYLARGSVYLAIGTTATAVAARGGGDVAGRRAVFRTVADQPIGNVLLTAAIVGFAGYATWRSVQAWALLSGDRSKADVGRALAYVGRAALYTVSAVYAASVIVTVEGSGDPTAPLVSAPPVAALVVGAVVGGYALFVAYRGAVRGFQDDLRTSERSRVARVTVVAVGVVGYLSRAAALALVSFATVTAALGAGTVEDIGLDHALGRLSEPVAGRLLLAAIGVGLAVFGLYSIVESWLRRVEVP